MLPNLQNLKYSDSGNFFLIAGPCVVEGADMVFEIGEKILKITDELKIPFIFKASYKKANRSRIDSFTGIGDVKALKILDQVREKLKVPVITDIHTPEDASFVCQFVDILQIPAFLCRQTELLVAAAKTGNYINIKKGQFVSPELMKFAAQKVVDSGNDKIMLTERGSTFGYHDLIVDYRSLPIMQEFGFPVILDITHSLQQPNQESGISGGKPELIETIARAAIAVGVDGIFLETHPHPKKAKSDGLNMLPLDKLENLLVKLIKLRSAVNSL